MSLLFGNRYGDYKCNHDSTHRVCAQLLDPLTTQPLSWGAGGDFWQITGQKQWQWDDTIRSNPNPGDSWCICMWATARLISKVGCENVHLHCDSTDVAFVLNSYEDGGHDLSSAHACLIEKCSPKWSKDELVYKNRYPSLLSLSPCRGGGVKRRKQNKGLITQPIERFGLDLNRTRTWPSCLSYYKRTQKAHKETNRQGPRHNPGPRLQFAKHGPRLNGAS